MSNAEETPPSPAPRGPVPGPMAGYVSPELAREHISQTEYLRLLAAMLRASAGVLFMAMPLLYLPTQFWTPIMTGIGLIMVVNGTLAVWTVGRDEPRFRAITRILVWAFPGAGLAVFLTASIFGPGLLGPDWDAMRARREPVTWQPPGL